MHIEKIVIKNFKKFSDVEFAFNSDTNIIVGDNDSGKSTLLEAIEMCLSCTYHGRPLAAEVTAELFNNDAVTEFLAGSKSANTLPEILIEVYLENAPADLRGTNNSTGENTEGLFVKIKPNPDLAAPYGEMLAAGNIISLPIEFYTVEWCDFAWSKLNKFTKKIKSLFVEPDRLHPTFGKNKYINGILDETLDVATRSTLNLVFRQSKTRFDDDEAVKAINDALDTDHKITSKDLKITTNVKSNATWDNNLHLAVDDVPFAHIGKGEQSQIQIKLALHNNADPVDVIAIEEPENHLSHTNLMKLVSYIEEFHDGKQLFISTHSSYVLNKLSVNKLCLLGSSYKRMHELDTDTIKLLKRLPGYNTLRIVLAAKAILVEGPSDELIVKKMFLETYEKLPEEFGIDVIVVSGLGFKSYLNIAKIVGTETLTIRDNDGDFEQKVKVWFEEYDATGHLTVSSSEDNTLNSLEPALIEANGATENELNDFAKIILSTQKNKEYVAQANLAAKKTFLKEWFKDNGRAKVDSALRIFECEPGNVIYPDYLKEALALAE